MTPKQKRAQRARQKRRPFSTPPVDVTFEARKYWTSPLLTTKGQATLVVDRDTRIIREIRISGYSWVEKVRVGECRLRVGNKLPKNFLQSVRDVQALAAA